MINEEEKRKRPYEVVPYNSEWKERFKEEKETLQNIFKEKALSIEHIGSTSVEGMWAKPQIDILVEVELLDVVDGLKEQMGEEGYNYHEDFEEFNERYFTRDAESGERLTSVHIRDKTNPQTESARYFRDYLREHPEARERYSKAKRKAYKEGADRVDYSKEKREVLDQIAEEAKNWYQENK